MRKVYELASILGVSNNQMIDLLREYNIEIKDHLSIVKDEVADEIFSKFNNESNIDDYKNKSSLEYICIKGLFNIYNYQIDFRDKINIFIAENGFGKTTILKIIVAILNGDKNKLKELPFQSVLIKLRETNLIQIKKEELKSNKLKESEVRYILTTLEDILPRREYQNIFFEYKNSKKLDTDKIMNYLKSYYRRINEMPYAEDIRYLDEIMHIQDLIWRYNKKNSKDNKINKVLNSIKRSVSEDVLYFPTYRRIEADRENFDYILDKKNRGYNSDVINFGMEDVKSILSELTEKLKQDAINYYSIMNGQILDDLLSDEVILEDKNLINIDKEKINIVIGRIGKDRIKQLEKLMDFINDNNAIKRNKDFLNYYLNKLIEIYEKQKVIDEKIKKFIDVCNKYLVNKKIVYDEVTAEVIIYGNSDNDKIEFHELSSGEKQIISLFAKLYLNTSKPVIFIIDEPELSLSIIWQQRLIKDIYDSGKIAMMIATTHSPYIFKNKYRIFAKDLRTFKEGDLNGF